MLTTSVAVSGCEWHEELRSAHAIQQHLLTLDSGLVAHADFSAVCRQAHAVGGDFYDFLHLPNGQLGFAIGDVAGKGLGAALLAANLQATLRAEARRAPSQLAEVISTVNQQFHAACFEEGYATLFYATFDPATRILKYVNAGHNPPLVRSTDSSIEWLDSGGAPVGMFESWPYAEGSILLNAGDMLVAYTDGVVEAQDTLGEDWGIGRLSRLLDQTTSETAAESNARIWKSVDRFAAGAAQRDDMTLLVLRVV
jgi:sigma-B regulation protein RsbU (phosphoserine phosphatase)